MTDLRPGDCVVCVNDGPCPDTGNPLSGEISAGVVYRVSRVWVDDGFMVVSLQGVDSATTSGGYLASRFRKVQKHLSQQDIKAWVNQPTDNTPDHLDKGAPVKVRT